MKAIFLVLAALFATGAGAANVGRTNVLLEVDRRDLQRQDVESLREEVRDALEHVWIATRAALTPLPLGTRIAVPDSGQRATATAALRKLSRPLPGGGQTLDIRDDGTGVSVAETQAALDAHVRTTVAQTVEILRRRLDAAAMRDVKVEAGGDDRMRVDLPATISFEAVRPLLATQAKLELRPVARADDANAEVLQPSKETPDDPPLRVERRTILTGADVIDVQSGEDAQTRFATIDIRLTQSATRRFATFTRDNVGRQLAMVLDGRIISAPIIRSEISGGALQIVGNLSSETARRIAILLRSGALPAKLAVVAISSAGTSGK